jgi:hypothetical protein
MKPVYRTTYLKNGLSLGYTTCLCGCQLWTSRKEYSKTAPKFVLGYNYKCIQCGRIEKEF